MNNTIHTAMRAKNRKPLLKSLFLAGAFALGAAMLPSQAHAQRVSPMAYDLAPSGSDATRALRVENTSQTAMTVELNASKISVDESGVESTVPAEDDFLIFPPQAIIKPGKVQTIRVKYVGDPAINHSEAYRIKVSQVPIDLGGEGKSAVGLVVNFHTLATVSPNNAKIELAVTSIKSNGTGGWDLVIENTGTKLARLSRTTWDVSDGSNKKAFSAQQVSDMTDKNLVMPGAKLALSIPAVEGMNSSTAKVKINAPS